LDQTRCCTLRNLGCMRFSHLATSFACGKNSGSCCTHVDGMEACIQDNCPEGWTAGTTCTEDTPVMMFLGDGLNDKEKRKETIANFLESSCKDQIRQSMNKHVNADGKGVVCCHQTPGLPQLGVTCELHVGEAETCPQQIQGNVGTILDAIKPKGLAGAGFSMTPAGKILKSVVHFIQENWKLYVDEYAVFDKDAYGKDKTIRCVFNSEMEQLKAKAQDAIYQADQKVQETQTNVDRLAEEQNKKVKYGAASNRDTARQQEALDRAQEALQCHNAATEALKVKTLDDTAKQDLTQTKTTMQHAASDALKEFPQLYAKQLTCALDKLINDNSVDTSNKSTLITEIASKKGQEKIKKRLFFGLASDMFTDLISCGVPQSSQAFGETMKKVFGMQKDGMLAMVEGKEPHQKEITCGQKAVEPPNGAGKLTTNLPQKVERALPPMPAGPEKFKAWRCVHIRGVSKRGPEVAARSGQAGVGFKATPEGHIVLTVPGKPPIMTSPGAWPPPKFPKNIVGAHRGLWLDPAGELYWIITGHGRIASSETDLYGIDASPLDRPSQVIHMACRGEAPHETPKVTMYPPGLSALDRVLASAPATRFL